MTRRLLALLLVVSIGTSALAAPKRRSSGQPAIDPSTTAGWLVANAVQLTTAEPNGYTYDVTALRRMIGSATTVGLGDDTHGTHEYFTVKLRLIDYLVRELGFEAVAFEAPFPLFNELNDYVVNGNGDPRAVLDRGWKELGYYFWDTEEILAVVQWMRDYNAHRGDRPPVEIVGVDVYDAKSAVNAVIAYLQTADPVFAADVQRRYACANTPLTPECRDDFIAVRNELAAKQAALEAQTSHRAYADALQNAYIAGDFYGTAEPNITYDNVRDAHMARNALWAKQNRGTNGKLILWAHQEHVGRTPVQFVKINPMGATLATRLGSDYFVIGTLSGSGSFLLTSYDAKTQTTSLTTMQFRDAPADSYEALFRTAGLPRLLVPLRGEIPDWLNGPHPFRFAGSAPFGSIAKPEPDYVNVDSLPRKLDAVIYFETTTPARPLP